MDTIKTLLENNFLELEIDRDREIEIDYLSILTTLSSFSKDQIIFTNATYEAGSQNLSFECFTESISIYAPLYYLNTDFLDILNKLIKENIPFIEKQFIHFEYSGKDIIALINQSEIKALASNNCIEMSSEFQQSTAIYLNYKNYKNQAATDNCFVGVFQYERNLNDWYIFYMEITKQENNLFTGRIFEGEDLEIRENPISISGQITNGDISFSKVYPDNYAAEFAALFNKDISQFHFPEEARTVQYSGKKRNGIYYGKWTKKESGIIFNGHLKEETTDNGYWELKKL